MKDVKCWGCVWCGERFSTYGECLRHEEVCPKRER